MNILLSAYECSPSKGSEYGRSWSWALNYINRGYHVWCLTSERGKKAIEERLLKEPIPNLHFYYISVPAWIEERYKKTESTFSVYAHYWYWLKNALIKAKQLTKEREFAWAHHVSWGSIQQGTSLWQLDIPLVFGPVGGGQFPPSFLKEYFLDGWKIEQKRKLISDLLITFNPNTKRSLQKAKLVLAVNEDTKILAERLGAKNTQYCIDIGGNKSNFESSNVEISRKKLKILWVGRLLFRKGLPLVLEALSLVPSNILFELTIIGDGPLGANLPKLLNKYNLSDKVIWKGQLPYDEVKKAYRTHDVFMFCSLRESLGLQYFEALSFGLPVITLDMHGAKNAISSDAAIKIALTNKEEILKSLVKAVVHVYSKPKIRQKLGKNGVALVDKIAQQDKVLLVEKYMR